MNDEYNGEDDKKNNDFSAKFRLQMDFQQTEEDLRKVRNEISAAEIQMRKYQQDFDRAKMVLDSAEVKLKALKIREYELNQNSARQKRAYISKK